MCNLRWLRCNNRSATSFAARKAKCTPRARGEAQMQQNFVCTGGPYSLLTECKCKTSQLRVTGSEKGRGRWIRCSLEPHGKRSRGVWRGRAFKERPAIEAEGTASTELEVCQSGDQKDGSSLLYGVFGARSGGDGGITRHGTSDPNGFNWMLIWDGLHG